jgi:hypothetical protein
MVSTIEQCAPDRIPNDSNIHNFGRMPKLPARGRTRMSARSMGMTHEIKPAASAPFSAAVAERSRSMMGVQKAAETHRDSGEINPRRRREQYLLHDKWVNESSYAGSVKINSA